MRIFDDFMAGNFVKLAKRFGNDRYEFPTIDQDTESGIASATALSGFWSAFKAMDRNPSRPSYAANGTWWIRIARARSSNHRDGATPDRPLGE